MFVSESLLLSHFTAPHTEEKVLFTSELSALIRRPRKGKEKFSLVIACDIHSCILNTLDVTKIVNEGKREGERLL